MPLKNKLSESDIPIGERGNNKPDLKISLPLNIRDSNRLLQELQLRELELELQIEKLTKTNQDLERQLSEIKQAKHPEELSYGERMFNTLAENAPDVIMILTPQLRYSFINSEIERITGIPASAFIGKTNEEMQMPKALCSLWNEMFQKAERTKGVQEAEIDFPGQNQNWFFNLRIVAKMDEFNQVQAYLGIWHDITSRKEWEKAIREREENYRLLFETMPIGLAISDSEGKITYGNRKSRILLGISRTELKQSAIDLHHWTFVNKRNEIVTIDDFPAMKFIRENRVIENTELGIVREKERITWLNVTTAVMPNNEDILIAFMDITEKIEREKQLKELSEKFKELNATKDKFFSIIAHDLKNPFNSILGFSELLLSNIEKYNLEEIEKFTGIINSTSQNAYNLLENLLNWSRAQTGSIEFSPERIDLAQLVSENLEFVDYLALKKCITIYFDPGGSYWVEADKNMIDTVLRNLLTNSIKFSYTGGSIHVEISQYDQYFNVSIKDNGIGIEPENLDKLFRIDSKYSTYGTNQEKGSGLGLIISKEFVLKNNGNIIVLSEFGKGSEFIISLPVAK